MSWRRGRATYILCTLLVVGFYLRSESLWQTVVVPPEIRADAKDYFMYAYNLTHHGVYSRDERGLTQEYIEIKPDALRSPGYPLYLSIFIGTESVGVFLARVLFGQALMSSLTVVVAFFMCRRFLNLFWASLATGLTAMSPHLVVMNSYLLTETLFCFFLVVACWWVGWAASKASWKTTGILGSLLAAAYLTRPSLQFFPLIFAFLMSAVLPNRKPTQCIAAFLLGFLLVTAPWFARNIASIGQFSDDTLQVAFVHHGIYPDFMYNQKAESYGFPYRFDPSSPAISRNTGTVFKEVMERFMKGPVEHATWFFLKKPIAFWSWNIVQGQGDAFVYPVSRTPYTNNPVFVWSHLVMRGLHNPLMWIGMMGCVLAWLPAVSRWLGPEGLPVVRFVSLLLAYFTALHVVGSPFPRYSVPLRPLIYGMAMFAAAFVWDYARNRLSPSVSPINGRESKW